MENHSIFNEMKFTPLALARIAVPRYFSSSIFLAARYFSAPEDEYTRSKYR